MWRLLAAVVLGTAFAFLTNGCVTRSDQKANGGEPVEKKGEGKLSGAELYALNCNRCHPERYAPERTAEQWSTILLHMRTRANLPAIQAREILHYLQEDSGK